MLKEQYNEMMLMLEYKMYSLLVEIIHYNLILWRYSQLSPKRLWMAFLGSCSMMITGLPEHQSCTFCCIYGLGKAMHELKEKLNVLSHILNMNLTWTKLLNMMSLTLFWNWHIRATWKAFLKYVKNPDIPVTVKVIHSLLLRFVLHSVTNL